MRISYIIIILSFFTASIVNAQQYPTSKGWEFDEHPLQKGWDQSKLDDLHKFIRDSTQMTSFMIVQHGKIVFDSGDLEESIEFQVYMFYQRREGDKFRTFLTRI